MAARKDKTGEVPGPGLVAPTGVGLAVAEMEEMDASTRAHASVGGPGGGAPLELPKRPFNFGRWFWATAISLPRPSFFAPSDPLTLTAAFEAAAEAPALTFGEAYISEASLTSRKAAGISKRLASSVAWDSSMTSLTIDIVSRPEASNMVMFS